jgi:hypothetical protein
MLLVELELVSAFYAASRKSLSSNVPVTELLLLCYFPFPDRAERYTSLAYKECAEQY